MMRIPFTALFLLTAGFSAIGQGTTGADQGREGAGGEAALSSMKFVRIPPGEFRMGSENGEADERPVHRVAITNEFYVQTTKVTQAQWGALMENPSFFEGADRPVENVSFFEVEEFIAKLNAREDGYLYRLPTEAEWEYACRAGRSGDDTGDLDAVAWYADNSGDEAHPVAQKQPNAWGLYDMQGNVWEWIQDYFAAYPQRPQEPVRDPRGPAKGGQHVVRGGSWYHPATSSRVTDRRGVSPESRGIVLGLRLVRTER